MTTHTTPGGRVLGRIAPQPARPQLKADRLLSTLSQPPASSDWQDNSIQWPMYGNDQIGDCTCAAVGHIVNQTTFYGSGTEQQPAESSVIGMYSRVTGYKPGKPSTDVGAYCQDVLADWRKNGLEGHKIVMYASIDPSNLTAVKQAINLFGAVYIGFNVTDAAENAFDAGKIWDVKKGARNLGGHCVPIGAYDSSKKALYGVTWAEEFGMTEAYWAQNVDEVWVYLDQDGVQKAGHYFTGVESFYTLGEDFAALTGEANPIPQPVDPTPPTPAGDYTAAQFVQDVAALMAKNPQ